MLAQGNTNAAAGLAHPTERFAPGNAAAAQPAMAIAQGIVAAVSGFMQPTTTFAQSNAADGLGQPATTITQGNAAADLDFAPLVMTVPHGNPGYALTSPPANVSVTTLADALKAAHTPTKFTTIDDAFSPDWDLSDPKAHAIYVKASEANSDWTRFAVGTMTSTILMDFIQDKSFHYKWGNFSASQPQALA